MEEHKNHNQLPEIDPLTNDKFVPEHEFDGIRELANNPPWWLTFIFIFSIFFAYIYLAKYHFYGDGDLQIQEYENAMLAANPEEKEEAGGISIETADIDFSVPLADASGLEKGAKIYKTNCAVCHLAEGQGLVGPNLTDDYWIHGGSFGDIIEIINVGVVEKGMIAWKGQLSAKQIHQVGSYITTLQGTNPPNPKAPEGEKYTPETVE